MAGGFPGVSEKIRCKVIAYKKDVNISNIQAVIRHRHVDVVIQRSQVRTRISIL